MKKIELPFVRQLESNILKDQPLIQVVLGPRQVGKTTGVEMLLSRYQGPYHYANADGQLSRSGSWLFEQWALAKSKDKNALLVVDEIQKVENWSEVVKQLFDQDRSNKENTRVILLGSSSLSIQKGLTESLAGRFYLHKVWHWNFQESCEAYGLSFDDYLTYGGYPASYQFIHQNEQWLNYMRESIINSVLGRDILSLVRVKSPSLFRQCFEIVCSYPAQEISYNKLLGQLQEKGNVDLVKNYLEHFEAAFLIKKLFKYSKSRVSIKTSSPKLLPLSPSLYSTTLDGLLNDEEKGRAFEIVVGMALLRKPGQLYYWREGQFEVDYIYEYQKKCFAIEVKTKRIRKISGLEAFAEKYKNSQPRVVTMDNFKEVLDRV